MNVRPLQPILITRPVLSVAPIIHAAACMGIDVAEPRKLHVTIACSREPVQWSRPVFLEDPSLLWLRPQSMPVVRFRHDRKGMVAALKLSSTALHQRHAALREAGASWDHASYQPHITLGPVSGQDLPDSITFLEIIELGHEQRQQLAF